MTEQNGRRRYLVGEAASLAPGERVIREFDGLSIGVFNVKGSYYALHNRCPHRGGALCLGPVTGTAVSENGSPFAYVRDGELIRCAWHGWEFDIATGRSLVDEKIRAKTFPVEVEDGNLYVLV